MKLLKVIIAIVLIAEISCVIDCTNVLEKDDADLFFTDNVVETLATSVYYAADDIEAASYTYTPLRNSSCLSHNLNFISPNNGFYIKADINETQPNGLYELV